MKLFLAHGLSEWVHPFHVLFHVEGVGLLLYINCRKWHWPSARHTVANLGDLVVNVSW